MKSKTTKTTSTYETVRHDIRIGVLVMALLSVAFAPAHAQQPNPQKGRGIGVWRTYRYVDGLANNTVYAMQQAADGNIWFGTHGGVSRFDGENWTTYTARDGLAGNMVHALLIDITGVIWAGTNGGLSRYDGEKWHSVVFSGGEANNEVTELLQDRSGAIWVGTRRGIRRYDGKAWQTVTPHATERRASTPPGRFNRRNSVTSLMQDREGTIWVGTMGGVFRFDERNLRLMPQTAAREIGRVITLVEDREGAIWVGTIGGGVSRFDGKKWTTYTKQDGLADDVVHTMMQDDTGAMWFGTETGGASRYDGEHWETYTTADGLASNSIFSLLNDQEGAIWFGTSGGGVSRLDTSSFLAYAQADGLVSDKVHTIYQDESGAMWFATFGGVSRFDGEKWTTYKDGNIRTGVARRPPNRNRLGLNHVSVILQNRDGSMWFGKLRGGVSRFDGKNWRAITRRDGLAADSVSAILQDRDGVMWFGTGNPTRPGSGVSRFDGKTWITITKVSSDAGVRDSGTNGLADNTVLSIFQDRDGVIWFGTGNHEDTGNGVSRFDGANWQTYTDADGLAHNTVLSIFQDRKGTMWFGTYGGGVSRYDGKVWTSYTTDDGLGSDYISAIVQDAAGLMWFGTLDGGVSRFDGRSFQTIDSRDGLLNDTVTSVYVDKNGAVWIGTLGGGAIRFTPTKKVTPPLVITQITADDQVYRNPDEHLKLPAGVKRVAFRFNAISFKTRPGGMRYYYRLLEDDVTWQRPTGAETVEYFNLKPGSYTFAVQAVDRDLSYSDVVTLRITIPALFYKTAGFLAPTVGGGAILLVMLVFQAVVLVKRRRQVLAYQQAAVEELKAAREMQLSLLPKSPPKISGFDIAGVCEPATDVGGDYFTYISWEDNKTQRGRLSDVGVVRALDARETGRGDATHLGIVLIDVTGHGMEAATTTFLANGMLQLESRSGSEPTEILAKMHQSLREILPKRAFVATSFAQINLRDQTLTHFNAGLPEPILLRDGAPVELHIQSSVPLGCQLPAKYVGTAVGLRAGDILLFFSDGLIEARNASNGAYEKVQLWELLKELVGRQTPAQAWVSAILADVRAFTAADEPADDMTVVVVKVL